MSETKKFKKISPLRYPGSKRKLVRYIYEIIKFNKLNPNVFIEPFVGGASISLNLLTNRIINKIIIADKDELIYSFWSVLFSNPDYLIRFIKRVQVNTDTFYRYKEIVKSPEEHYKEKLAEACLFLNRTSFSGILKNNVGPIGGKDQKSKYKINCRFNKGTLIEEIRYISKLKRKVIVLPYDWEETIEYAINWSKNKKRLNKLFFYVDPPFYNKAKKLYRCYFDDEEHKELFKKLILLNFDWVLSYDNAEEIKELYSSNDYIKMHFEMPYSINSHSKRLEKELVISPLNLP